MFQIFKNFVTYFLILLISKCSCRPTIDYEKKVEDKIAPFSKFVNMILNYEDKCEFKGQLKVLASRAIETDTLLVDHGALKNKMQIQSNALWFERVRSAIEKFEDGLAKNAEVEFPSYKEEKYINIRERIFRERKWKWIFKNKPNEDRVQTLISKINDSKDVTSTDEFSILIARAFSELSEYIHQEILRPGSGNFIVKFASSDPRVNRAIELFMDLFEIRDIIAVPKQKSY